MTVALGQQTIITIATYNPDEILPLTDAEHMPRRRFVIDGVSYLVKMRSRRYDIFRENRSCLCCGVVGTVMALQIFKHDKDAGRDVAHFNLYGYDKLGNAVLLTKDHITPRSLGGGNRLENYRTLCIKCNGIRGTKDVTIEELREIVDNWTLPDLLATRRENKVLKFWQKKLRRARKMGFVMPKREEDWVFGEEETEDPSEAVTLRRWRARLYIARLRGQVVKLPASSNKHST